MSKCIGWEHECHDTHEEIRENLQVFLISIYHADPNNCAQVLGLGDKSFCQVSLEFENQKTVV